MFVILIFSENKYKEEKIIFKTLQLIATLVIEFTIVRNGILK